MEEQNIRPFSQLEYSMQQFALDVRDKADMRPAEPFPKSDMTENKRLARIIRAEKDFFEFDKIYFPEDMYSQGYSKSGSFHKKLYIHAQKPGVHIIPAARKHGKTVLFKKYMTWVLLTGKHKFCGTMSSTLPVSWNILGDVYELIAENPRIMNDFKPSFIEKNNDQFTFRVPKSKGIRRCMAFSEGRSVKGASYIFERPEFILCDDIETRKSPLGEQQVDARIRFIGESFNSMSDSGILIVLGNNFDEKCALNRLKVESEKNALPANWYVHVYKAWNNNKPLWKERYPARTESELRSMLNPYDESEWQGDFQQNPVAPEGIIFKRSAVNYYDVLPKNVRGVIYCDPNLAKKGKGDTTAVTPLLYSGETDLYYYFGDAICRSISDPNELLDIVLNRKYESAGKIIAVGFDGHVAQESTWSAFVRHWSKQHNKPYSIVEYKLYHVDDLAKNTQAIFHKILFPRHFADTQDGKRYFDQLFSFQGKKANRKDDAPDSLISAHEFLTERGVVRRSVGYDFPLVQLL